MSAGNLYQYSSEEMKLYLLQKAVSQPERRKIITYLKVFGQAKTSVIISLLDISKASVKDGLHWLASNQIISLISKGDVEFAELKKKDELLELEKKVIDFTKLSAQKFMHLERSFKA
jgi:hypothetical protein